MKHIQSRRFKLITRSCMPLCFGLFLLVSGIDVYTASADVAPPYLVNPIPAPGSTTDNWFIVRTGVLDDESGVNPDPDTVMVKINGAPPRVKPIIEPSYGQKNGIKITVLLSDEFRQNPIQVSVRAQDLAEQPNIMESEWTFFLDGVSQNPIPIVTYPENHRWLEYDSENGCLLFSWLSRTFHEYYRMRFTFPGTISGSIDLGPFKEASSFQSESLTVQLTPEEWATVASIGEVCVDVAPLDGPDGNELTPYSAPTNINYIIDDIPSLIRPYHSAILDPVIPPVFEWQPVDSQIDGYVAVFVRLDENGLYTDDIIVFEVPMFIKTIPMDATIWNRFSTGTWAWAVLAEYPESDYSNFMIYRFMKD
jgi:hypothetical protein